MLDSSIELHGVDFVNGEVALKAHAVERNIPTLKVLGQVVESHGFRLALMFNTIVVQVEHSVRVGTVGIDEGRVDVVVADGTLPHGLSQGVAIGIGADDALVIVQTFVHHIPFRHLALEMFHHAGDVVLHDVKGLLARPALVVLLAVAAQPCGLLRVPDETVAADGHIVTLGEADEIVSTAVAELSLAGLQGLHFHLILGHHHVELTASLVAFALITFIGAHRHADVLTALLGIVTKGVRVGSIVNAVIIVGPHARIVRMIRVVRVVRIVGVFE